MVKFYEKSAFLAAKSVHFSFTQGDPSNIRLSDLRMAADGRQMQRRLPRGGAQLDVRAQRQQRQNRGLQGFKETVRWGLTWWNHQKWL